MMDLLLLMEPIQLKKLLFLNLYFSNLSVPIVLTGSMKVFSDNYMMVGDNLISSIFVASNSLTKNYGVLVIFKNIIMSALRIKIS